MKKTKKIISIISLLAMLFSLLPMQVLQVAYAEPVGTMAEKVEVFIDKNGGSQILGGIYYFTLNKNENFILPSNIDLLKAPEGKKFKAWEINGVEKNIGEEISLIEDTTIKAIWKNDDGVTTPVEEILLTLKSNNISSGSNPPRSVAKYHLYLLEYDVRNYSEYVAGKRVTKIKFNGVERKIDEPIVLIEDTTIEFIYEDIEFVKITLDGNGSVLEDNSGSMYEFKFLKDGFFMIPNHNIFKVPEGKKFKAWDIDGTEKNPGDNIHITENTILKAVWIDDVGVIDPIETTKVYIFLSKDESEKIEYLVPNYTLIKLKDSGRDSLPDNLKENINYFLVDDSLYKGSDEVHVVGKSWSSVRFYWKPEKVKVNFMKNDYILDGIEKEVNYGEPFTLPENLFEAPEGKEFKAWDVGYNQEKQPGEQIDFNNYAILGTFNIRALWEDYVEIAKISFDAGDGTGTMSALEVSRGKLFVLPENEFTPPTGKEFKAWKIEGNLGSEFIGGDIVKKLKKAIKLPIEKKLEFAPGEAIFVTGKDIKLKAIWQPVDTTKKYSISYFSNTSSIVTGKKEAKVGELVNIYQIPNEDEYDYYAFALDEENNVLYGEKRDTFDMPDSNVRVYGMFIPKNASDPVNVTMNLKNGIAPHTIEVNKNSKFFLPVDPISFPEGKYFKGWKIGSEEKNIGEEITVTEDITIEAIWIDASEVKVTVKFDANGGSGTMEPIQIPFNSEFEAPVSTFTPPAGKRFKAWEVFGEQIYPGFKASLGRDITLKAIWESDSEVISPQKVSIIFDANGGEGENYEIKWNKDENFTIPINDTFTPPTGKKFKAWEVNGDEKYPGDEIAITESTTIVAKWEDDDGMYPVPIYSTITYQPSNDIDSPIYEMVEQYSMKTIPSTTVFIAPDGKEYKGWEVNGVEKSIGDVIVITGDTTVKIIWKDKIVKVTIIFDADGGTGTMTDVEVNKNTNYTLPANGFTAPDGKEFKAWLVGTEEKEVGDIITVSADTTIKALWKEKTTITPPSGGSGSEPYSPVRPDPIKPEGNTDTGTSGSGTSGSGSSTSGGTTGGGTTTGTSGGGATTTGTTGGITTTETSTTETRFKIGSRTFNKTVNGVPTTIDMGIAPYIRNGRVMIPLRFVGEAIGYEAKWNPTTRTVTLENKDNKIEVPINTNNIIVNGKTYTGDVRPTLESGRVMLSIGNIVKALGENSEATIKWKPTTQEVVVKK